jgi:hypothetical protein
LWAFAPYARLAHRVLKNSDVKDFLDILSLRHQELPAILSGTREELPTTIINDTILDELEKEPFSSIRELAMLTCIPKKTIHRPLARSLGFIMKHRHWIPDSLMDTQKAQRVTLSNELLREFQSIQTSQ